MTIQRMDNVGIIVDDLEAAIAFFTELGMELEGKAQIEGPWADRTVGLDGVRCDISMMRIPDGHGRLELAKYLTPAMRQRLAPGVSFASTWPVRLGRRLVSHPPGTGKPR